VFFYLIQLSFSGFLPFIGNFIHVCGQNNSKYCDWAPLRYLPFYCLSTCVELLPASKLAYNRNELDVEYMYTCTFTVPLFQVYYHLGAYDDSLTYALGAGDLFDVNGHSEYVETIIGKVNYCQYLHVLKQRDTVFINFSIFWSSVHCHLNVHSMYLQKELHFFKSSNVSINTVLLFKGIYSWTVPIGIFNFI